MENEKLDNYEIILPKSGKGRKEIKSLYKHHKKETEKAIRKLKKNPTNFKQKSIEKIKSSSFGSYTIRVTISLRLFYDVDLKAKRVKLLRAGSHDYYKLA